MKNSSLQSGKISFNINDKHKKVIYRKKKVFTLSVKAYSSNVENVQYLAGRMSKYQTAAGLNE